MKKDNGLLIMGGIALMMSILIVGFLIKEYYINTPPSLKLFGYVLLGVLTSTLATYGLLGNHE